MPHLRVRAGHDRPAAAGGDRRPGLLRAERDGAATLLASTDVIGVERAADLMAALLKAPVSTGFVSRCLVRLDAALTAAGFEDALKDALRAAGVLGTDETPAPLTTAATSAKDCGNPHVYTVRTMRAYTGGGPDLIWYGAAGNRTKAAITGFGILDGYRGVLVRDDYGGYLSYDTGLAGVQQCLAHLYRYLDDAYAIDPESQAWTRQAGDALRAAAAAVRTARDASQAELDPALLARLRHSYDQAVAFGISVNLSRPWHKGNHPGLILARRLKRKAAQVWLFATRFDVPADEQRIGERRSAATSSPRKSAAAGAPSPPCSATAASAPTSPPPAATAATPSPPSATPSTATAGCRRNQPPPDTVSTAIEIFSCRQRAACHLPEGLHYVSSRPVNHHAGPGV